MVAKKLNASKASRHSRKYLRKGTNVQEFEEVLVRKNKPKTLDDAPVEELFVFDNEPMTESPKKYTKRQQAKLNNISLTAVDLDDDKDNILKGAKAPPRIQEDLKRRVQREEPIIKRKNVGATYDLWETDFTPKLKLNDPKAAAHILSNTKKKIPKKPDSLMQKSSLLPAVSLPAAGASYNPTAEDYEEYVHKIALKEQKFMEIESKMQCNLKPKYEKLVTEEERMLEETEGLFDDAAESDKEIANKEEEIVRAAKTERKTKKDKKNEAKVKAEERQKLLEKKTKQGLNEVFRAKQINKELAKQEEAQKKKSAEKRLKKMTKKLTTRQQLGRGRFEEEEDPFLLNSELPEALRSLKPQGNILQDRMKSLQKRNILPIGGDRQKAKKKSLRKRWVEKRTVKEVKQGSRVI